MVIIHLNPVSIGVFEVDLLDAVNAFGDGILFTRPAFVGDLMLLQPADETGHGGHRKAEVHVFVVHARCSSAADDMEVALADAEPGMAAIVKGFGDGIETNDITVKSGAFLQVNHVEGNMVELGFGLGIYRAGSAYK